MGGEGTGGVYKWINVAAFERAGSKTNVLLACCTNQETFQKHLLRKQNVSEKFRNTFETQILPASATNVACDLLRARANRETFLETLKFRNVSATIFPRLPRRLALWMTA